MLVLALLTTLTGGILAADQCGRRVCYYTNWPQYRVPDGKMVPEDVDANLCTHLIYSFADMNGTQLVATEANDESVGGKKGMWERFTDLKQQNPDLKTMIAVGGWTMGTKDFTAMVATAASRKEFVDSTISFLRSHNFDGLDIDWEYPCQGQSSRGQGEIHAALSGTPSSI